MSNYTRSNYELITIQTNFDFDMTVPKKNHIIINNDLFVQA